MIRGLFAKLSVLTFAAALLVSSFVSDAKALVLDLGLLSVPGTTNSGVTLGPSDSLPIAFSFQVNAAADIDALAATFEAGNFGINNLGLSLFKGSPNPDGSAGSSLFLTSGTTTVDLVGIEVVEFVFAGLDAFTDYFIQATGNLGSEGGSLVASITVVPLPPAVLLFASALIGFACFARFRRKPGETV